MQPNKHRTWGRRSTSVPSNITTASSARPQKAPVLCVVKADCYGHGAVPVANRLQSMGAPYFAVATVPEAVELRENGIKKPIIILGYIDAADMDTVAEYGITAPVYDEETAELLSAAAVRTGRDITVHYKLDTGMTRIGFPSWEREETVRRILECAKKPGLRSEGIFTHFAVADVPSGEEYTEMQYDRFRGVCEGLAENGLDLPLRHCANSGAIQSYRKMHCTMTRAGIILYGYRPDASVPPVLDLEPAMTVKARVVQVRDIPAHTTISYGRTFETGEPTHMAVVSVGYADGFLRTGSGEAARCSGRQARARHGPRLLHGYVHGAHPGGRAGAPRRRGHGVRPGRVDGGEDAAEAAGTISYEVLCAVSRRVPRYCIGLKSHRMKRGSKSAKLHPRFFLFPAIIFAQHGDNRFAPERDANL